MNISQSNLSKKKDFLKEKINHKSSKKLKIKKSSVKKNKSILQSN
jgi:hypothetical protein